MCVLSTLYNKLVSTELYNLRIMCLFKFYKVHVDHMLKETDMSNQLKVIES